jgi:hypothetical protein
MYLEDLLRGDPKNLEKEVEEIVGQYFKKRALKEYKLYGLTLGQLRASKQ